MRFASALVITVNDIDYSVLNRFPLSSALKVYAEPVNSDPKEDKMNAQEFIELCQTVAALNHAERCQVARYRTKQRIDAFAW